MFFSPFVVHCQYYNACAVEHLSEKQNAFASLEGLRIEPSPLCFWGRNRNHSATNLHWQQVIIPGIVVSFFFPFFSLFFSVPNPVLKLEVATPRMYAAATVDQCRHRHDTYPHGGWKKNGNISTSLVHLECHQLPYTTWQIRTGLWAD